MEIMKQHSITWPKISVITPSYNQAKFLERTILSVLEQNYPNLEYIIIDGGSTDGSMEVIKQYQDQLAYWECKPDDGQTHAINKGLKRATGELIGWQNSDDIYEMEAFISCAKAAQKYPHKHVFIGNMNIIDANDRQLRDLYYVKPTYNALRAEGMVLANQAAFWRRDVHETIGYMDESLNYAFDYEWFLRLLKQYDAVHTDQFWGNLRYHDQTKMHNLSEKFTEERRKFYTPIEPNPFFKKGYRIRRLGLTLRNGHIKYVTRGLWQRFSRSLSKEWRSR